MIGVDVMELKMKRRGVRFRVYYCERCQQEAIESNFEDAWKDAIRIYEEGLQSEYEPGGSMITDKFLREWTTAEARLFLARNRDALAAKTDRPLPRNGRMHDSHIEAFKDLVVELSIRPEDYRDGTDADWPHQPANPPARWRNRPRQRDSSEDLTVPQILQSELSE